MRRRLALFVVTMTLVDAAAASPTASHAATARFPAISGHATLLTTADVQVIVAAAREKLSHTATPWTRIYAIDVHTANDVEAYYGNPLSADSPAFIMHRTHGRWRITGIGAINR
jgi:hypothetical protein